MNPFAHRRFEKGASQKGRGASIPGDPRRARNSHVRFGVHFHFPPPDRVPPQCSGWQTGDRFRRASARPKQAPTQPHSLRNFTSAPAMPWSHLNWRLAGESRRACGSGALVHGSGRAVPSSAVAHESGRGADAPRALPIPVSAPPGAESASPDLASVEEDISSSIDIRVPVRLFEEKEAGEQESVAATEEPAAPQPPVATPPERKGRRRGRRGGRNHRRGRPAPLSAAINCARRVTPDIAAPL